jgi:hypothetical protein
MDRDERDRMIEEMLCVARGCLDYGGGYRDNEGKLDAFHHGIQTVVNALEGYRDRPGDSQVMSLWRAGRFRHRGS